MPSPSPLPPPAPVPGDRSPLASQPPWVRAASAAYAPFALSLMVVFGAMSSLLIWPFAPLPRGRRERYSMYGAQWFAWMCLRPALLARITVRGRELLPKEQGFLVVCNHRSFTDVALLQLYTRSNGVSKKEVAWIPFFGLNGYLTGAIFFDRKNRLGRARVIEEAVDLMRSGAALHVFPEGTRTRTGYLSSKVHLRLVQTASEHGFPVVPACVWNTEQAVPANAFGIVPGQAMGLELGAPISRLPGEAPEAHAERVWSAVIELARRNGADGPFA